MQTFLPFPDYYESARCLDRQRLGKQRVETYQIMKALLTGSGWVNHPATRMWEGCEWQLLLYQAATVKAWTERGYSDTTMEKTEEVYFKYRFEGDCLVPWWLGLDELHISHQSNLIRKDPDHYAPMFPGVPDNIPYLWPV